MVGLCCSGKKRGDKGEGLGSHPVRLDKSEGRLVVLKSPNGTYTEFFNPDIAKPIAQTERRKGQVGPNRGRRSLDHLQI
ncbi:hypothetical protein KKH36_01390 [Patescibacteria group bacterium]|nr:hypothetical protein [Patescibacteria group bacterium]